MTILELLLYMSEADIVCWVCVLLSLSCSARVAYLPYHLVGCGGRPFNYTVEVNIK